MKRLLLVLLLLFVPLLFISCSNDDSQELEFYPQDDGTYVVAIGRAKYRENITIPPTYNGGAVVAIDNYGFSEAPKLKTITIPDSVTSIGDRAFYDCDSLTSVVIPDSVTSIGDRAFYNCNSLTSVVIPDSVTSIGEYAFCNCFKLVEVINKSSLDITAGSDFHGYIGCYAIEVHSGESKIKNANDYLFYSFEGVNYLLGYVGSDKDLVLPESYNGENYEIYKYAFYDCDSLTSVVIGDGVTGIGDEAFCDCRNLTSVVIGDSVKDLGSFAFAHCSNLVEITLGESLASIGYNAFRNCNSLTSVVIPDSVTSIGGSAFEYCDALETVYYTGTAEEWAKIRIDSGNYALTDATRYYYSETAPTTSGNFWHYDSDGKIVVW